MLRSAGTDAGVLPDATELRSACWLAAFVGETMVGVAGVETMVDAAAMRWLVVAESSRGCGIGAALVGAARKAAHTRGARRLYALCARGSPYLEHFGFERVPAAEMLDDLAGTTVADYLRARPDELARTAALLLDISRDGIIER